MKTFNIPYLVLRSSGVPAVSNAGEARMYYDASLAALLQSVDGSPWAPVGEGDIISHTYTGLEVDSDGVLVLARNTNQGSINFSHQYRLTLDGTTISVESAGDDPTGINNPQNLTMSFDDGTRTFTVGTDGTDVLYSAAGRAHRLSAATSVEWSNLSGLHLFYFDADGYLQTAVGHFQDGYWQTTAPIAIIYWNADTGTSVYRGYEAHSSNMPGHVHAYLHNTRGAAWQSGFELTDFILNASGALDSHARFGCADGVFHDEDIRHEITDANPQNMAGELEAPTFYRIGTAWRRHDYNIAPLIWSDGFTFTGGSGLPAYNLLSAGVWSLAEVGNDNYVLLHVLATNDITTPILTICGIGQYNTITAARNAAPSELASISGLPFAEIITVGTVIYQVRASYANTVKARIRSINNTTAYVDLRSGARLLENSAQLHSALSGLTNPDHPAAAIYTDTAGFDGYVLTDESNVQDALVTLGNSVRQFTKIVDGYYSSTINIDFAAQKLLHIGVISGDIEFTTSNIQPGFGVVIRFTADGTNRNITLPAWKFFGTAPTSITANKTGVLTLLAWGTTDSDVDAGWVENT